jgi:uncharacterized membrane protein
MEPAKPIAVETPAPPIRRYFFTGILVTAPIGLTLYVAWWFVTWVDSLVTPYLPDWLVPFHLPFNLPGVGLIVAFVTLTLIGAVMNGFLGNWFTKITEIFLHRVPVVKTIYTVIKQVLHTALTDQSKAFKEAVLVEFPRKDSWVLAFATARGRTAINDAVGQNMVAVFVPTTPNLTSGYLIFVAETDIKPVAMPPEEALKLIISGGLVS